MYCRVCKIEYPEGKKFCKECGSPLVEKRPICPKCQVPLTLKPDEKYCNECGTLLAQAIQGITQPKQHLPVIWLGIFGFIFAGLVGSIILYHYTNYKIPFVERYFQLIESKIWKPPPDTLAKARAVKDSVKVFPIDGPLYEESGKLFYWESRKPAIPSGSLKKGEIVNIISVGKSRDEEQSRISVKIRSSAGMTGYVGVPGDVEITRIFSDEAAYRLLPAKLWYEWEGNPEPPIDDARVYEEFIKSFSGSKYFPNAKLVIGLNYWAASTLYEHPMQPYLQKDIKKAEIYRRLARNNLKDILIKFPGSNFAIIADKYLKKIERGEKHPYVTKDTKELNSLWSLMKELKKGLGG